MKQLCVAKSTILVYVYMYMYIRTYELTSPQLMDIPSLALSPVAPVLFSLSEPARSTK